MEPKTFPAQISNGELLFQQTLDDLEGQRVLVTLMTDPSSMTDETPDDAQIPEWMSVEREVVFRMPYQWQPVRWNTIEAGMITPSVILPEELLDE